MKGIKCYWNYTPKFYRLLGLILFPISLAVVSMVMSANKVPVIVITGVLGAEVFYEIFADIWMLNGIQTKDYCGIRLVQSSVWGKEYMKNVVLVDCVRRYVYLAVICLSYLLVGFLGGESKNFTENAVFLWNIFWLAGAVISLFLWISRYFANMAAVMLLAYGAVFAFSFAAGFLGTMQVGCVIYPLISLGMMALCVGIGKKKMEGSYYDR